MVFGRMRDHPVRDGVASRPSSTRRGKVAAFPSSQEEGCRRRRRGGVVLGRMRDHPSGIEVIAGGRKALDDYRAVERKRLTRRVKETGISIT